MDLFREMKISEDRKTAIFCKYFDPELIIEARASAEFEGEKETIESLSIILNKLFEKKTSNVEIIAQLFTIKQGNSEDINSFSKRIRIAAVGLRDDKEHMAIQAFIKGLQNKHLASALKYPK